jgi:nicotinate-nucleotide pyrophosphorylase (carboxylating)
MDYKKKCQASGIRHQAPIYKLIRECLEEDIGNRDVTTQLLVPPKLKAEAVIIAKERGVICGIDVARLVFKSIDKNIRFQPLVKEAELIKKGQALIKLQGKAVCILTAERVALNFLGLLSGIATYTAEFVKRVRLYGVKLLDTRKTLPGLRTLEKYAVRVGGGYNHRSRLDEMILIKDNHIKVSGIRYQVSGIKGVIERVKAKKPKDMRVEIEVRTLREFKRALEAEPDMIMLDNMSIRQVKKAVRLRNQLSILNPQLLTKLEASGNINLNNICAFARTGVDFISVGSLTKDIRSLDLSLKILNYP